MARAPFIEGVCDRCGGQAMVRRRAMFHGLGEILYAKREMICARCLRQSRVLGAIALFLLLIALGSVIALPFIL